MPPKRASICNWWMRFISPDFVVLNRADNGAIELALTQLAPNGPKSGSGELARATMVGISAGFANFAFGEVTFSDNNGQAMAVTKQDCLVEVGETGAPTPTSTSLPAATPTSTPTNTNVPPSTAEPQAQSAVNTPAPTTAPTIAPTNTAVPTATTVPQVATATNTPLPPSPTPTGVESTSSGQGATATSLPTLEPTATATVLVISTPTPSQAPLDLANRQADAVPSPTAQATPVSTSLPTSFGDGSPTETPAPVEESGSAQAMLPALGQEVLSPPTIDLASEGAASLATETEAVHAADEARDPSAGLQPEPTVTPTTTPIVIARVVQPAPRVVEAVQQPQATEPPVRRTLLQALGWLSLLLTSVLAVVVWRLRRA